MAGEGQLDLVMVNGWVTNLELMWEDPGWSAFCRRLASFSRLILFDKRGTGLSDRVSIRDMPTLEERMDDVRAVMDAVGSSRAFVLGVSEGGPMSDPVRRQLSRAHTGHGAVRQLPAHHQQRGLSLGIRP